MAELAVTAIGIDRPGIVAAVAGVLRERGGNVEDSAMTILAGNFAMMLLVEIGDTPAALHDALAQATADMNLTITVTEAATGHRASAPNHVLSVYGADRPGILEGISGALAGEDANITDLETRMLGSEDEPVYAMVIELWTDDPGAVERAVADSCSQLGVDHTLRPIESETY